MILLGIQLSLSGRAQEAKKQTAAAERLSPIVDFVLKSGTNRPVSKASAKALGLGEQEIPATQLAFVAPGETQVHIFGVSSRNTNDLLVGLIDQITRSGKVWLTSPDGEIRVTILTSTNGPPQVVPNDGNVEQFVEQIGMFFSLAAMGGETNGPPLSGDEERLGDENPDASGTVREISDRFGHDELQKLYQILNSAEFQAPFTNYTCGEPAPKLRFSVSLRPTGFATTRAVEIYHSPALSPSGHTRCLLFGVGYLLDKAVAKLDPDPKQEDTRNPHCDCSKRDTKGEWVTHPGPSEILAPAKVAAKHAARAAEEAGEEKEENLAVTHLDSAGVQVEPNGTVEHLLTREKLLATFPRGPETQLLAVDPSFSHCAYVIKKGRKQLVALDGVEGKDYDEIPDHQELVFSRDGKRLAYIAKRGGKMVVVVDGKEGKAYDNIEELFHPRFSPDGKRLAYIAQAVALGFPPVKSFAVVDGEEQKRYDMVEGIFFSPDSKHVAYQADKQWNRGTVVVVDGKEGKAYDQITGECFSPDGNRFAFVGYNRTNRSPESAGEDFAVVDGKAGKPHPSVSTIMFSPDSKHVAYVAGKGTGGMGVLDRDGTEKKYGHVELGPFSPDNQHLAFVARFGTNWLVLIDGKKLDPQERSSEREMSFSPFRDLTFSPDIRHLAYIARGPGTNWSVLLDGKSVKTCERIAVSPEFSPDSRLLAYVIQKGGKAIPVLGGHAGKEYDQVVTWRMPLEEGSRTVGFVFDDLGVFRAIGRRGQEIFQIELELVKN